MKSLIQITTTAVLLIVAISCNTQSKQSNPVKSENLAVISETESESTNQVEYEANDDGSEYVKLNGEYVSCPIMGHKGLRDLYSDYQEKRYFFCCGGCKPEFEANQESYIEKGAIGVPLSDLPTS